MGGAVLLITLYYVIRFYEKIVMVTFQHNESLLFCPHPEVLNIEQGFQYTSTQFTGILGDMKFFDQHGW